MKNYFLFSIVLTASVAVFADTQSCGPVDIRQFQSQRTQDYFRKAKNQNNSGWCYAFAAADLLSDRLQLPVSAYGLAFDYNSKLSSFDKLLRRINYLTEKSQHPFLLDGGWSDAAIEQALHNERICLDSEAVSEISGVSSVKHFFVSLEALWMEGALSVGELSPIFPRAKATDLALGIRTAQMLSEDFFELLSRIGQLSCEMMPGQREQVHLISAGDIQLNPMEFINSRLSLGRPRPVAVLIHSDGIYKDDESSFFERQLGDHYSVIIGRQQRALTGRCEYLVRDSMGAGCERYSSKVQCLGDGTYWIDSSFLEEIVEKATSLD